MERRGHLIQLLEEVGCVGKQLKQIQINVQEQLEQRANLVGLIIKEQKQHQERYQTISKKPIILSSTDSISSLLPQSNYPIL